MELAEDYVQLAEGQAGEINAIPVPMLDRGSHLSYAFQWIAFGIMAPAGLIYFLWAEVRERRRFKQEQEELLVDAPTTASTPAPRGRYGHTKRNPWASAYDREQER